MGKVWRARHTALRRDDALKVLPDAFASDPGRVARFQREAQVLASLNHPNIAHVYGLEQLEDAQALVMELVEGPTLADRIARGPIPLDEDLLTFDNGRPLVGFVLAQGRVYDVSPDGQRILVNAAEGQTSEPITVVVNWQSVLGARGAR